MRAFCLFLKGNPTTSQWRRNVRLFFVGRGRLRNQLQIASKTNGKMQQNPNQRVVYLDLLRVLATFAVIFLHVSAAEFLDFHFSKDWYVSLVGDSLVRWCVPVFVMISGALFLRPERNVTYREILRLRVPRLLVAYIFWTVVFVMYGFFMTGFYGFSVKHLIRRSILGSHFHLWFLPMLMGVYLLIPILRKIAQDRKLLRYALVIWMVYIFVGFFQFSEAFKLMKHFYSLFTMNTIVGFAGYFLLGYYLSTHSFSRRQRIWIYLFGICGALVTVFGTYFISTSTGEANGRYFSNLSVQVMAMGTTLFVLIKQLAPKCGNVLLRLNDFVRKDLFGVYLTHALWLPVVNTEAFRHCCSEIITLPLITIIVFILSLFTTKLIRLIPYLRKVVE